MHTLDAIWLEYSSSYWGKLFKISWYFDSISASDIFLFYIVVCVWQKERGEEKRYWISSPITSSSSFVHSGVKITAGCSINKPSDTLECRIWKYQSAVLCCWNRESVEAQWSLTAKGSWWGCPLLRADWPVSADLSGHWTMSSLFAGSKSTPKSIAYDDPAMQSQVPDEAWIITVWIKEIRGLVPGMSGDVGGRAVH